MTGSIPSGRSRPKNPVISDGPSLFQFRDRDWPSIGLIALIVFMVGPLVLAGLTDLAWWSFTGHECFPWIGHAMNGDASVTVKVDTSGK